MNLKTDENERRGFPARAGRVLWWVGQRHVVWYAVLFLLLAPHVDTEKGLVQRLNRLMPDSRALAAYAVQPDTKAPRRLFACVEYFEAVSAYLPDAAPAHGILGFCYDELGFRDEAVTQLKTAAALDPAFFWHPYDLGLIYFREGQYARAAEYLLQAVETKPSDTLRALGASKLYIDLLRHVGDLGYDVSDGLMDAYRNAYALLAASYYYQERYEEVLPLVHGVLRSGLADTTEFYLYGGVAAHEDGDDRVAVQLLQEYLARRGSRASALRVLGQSLKRMGMTARAAAVQRQAGALATEEPVFPGAGTPVTLRIF